MKNIIRIKFTSFKHWIMDSVQISDKDLLVKTVALLFSLWVIFGLTMFILLTNLIKIERTDLYIVHFHHVFNYEEIYTSFIESSMIFSLFFASGIAWGFYAIMMITREKINAISKPAMWVKELMSGFVWMGGLNSDSPCWESLRIDEFSEEDKKDMTFEKF